MAYDIYGQHLERGHCEVHPWVHEEYPCPVCLDDSRRRRDEQREYERYMREQEDQYYADMRQAMIDAIFADVTTA